MRGSRKKAISLFISGIIFAGIPAQSQSTRPEVSPAYKTRILNEIVQTTVAKHFSPKPYNDDFSISIWKKFLQHLDPGHNIFLQPDIASLQSHRLQIDDQLKTGSSAFFDAAMSIYRSRLAEVKSIYPELLRNKIDLEKTETLNPDLTDQSFPVNNTERINAWRKTLTVQVLKRYTTLLNGKGGDKQSKTIDPVLEAIARHSVQRIFDGKFSQLLSEKAMDEKFYQYANMITMEMDPHSNFYQPGLNQTFPGSDGKPYYSLGLILDTADAEVFIKRIVPGTVVANSGKLFENERIISIEDNSGNMVPVSGMNKQEASLLLTGSKDKPVKMILENSALEERTVSIPREELKETSYKPTSAIIVHNGKKTGLIYLPWFYGQYGMKTDFGAEGDLLKELKKLMDQEIESLIIDLRGNPGGSTFEAEQIFGALYGGGNVSMLKGKYSTTTQRSYDLPPIYKGPLLIMVDESSASASEMLSAAIQDHGRGIVIGTASSFGKGTAQITNSIFGKEEGSTQITSSESKPIKTAAPIDFGSIKITEKKFYRINGISTQFRGVIPDIILQQRMSATSIREKDYPTALPADTIKTDYKPAKRNFNYDLVVKKAKERISKNNSMLLIDQNMAKLEKLQTAPYELNWKRFEARSKDLAMLKESIKNAMELNSNGLLPVETSMPPWINPSTIHPYQNFLYEDWLNNMKKDIYLKEALSVLEDMIANPA